MLGGCTVSSCLRPGQTWSRSSALTRRACLGLKARSTRVHGSAVEQGANSLTLVRVRLSRKKRKRTADDISIVRTRASKPGHPVTSRKLADRGQQLTGKLAGAEAHHGVPVMTCVHRSTHAFVRQSYAGTAGATFRHSGTASSRAESLRRRVRRPQTRLLSSEPHMHRSIKKSLKMCRSPAELA